MELGELESGEKKCGVQKYYDSLWLDGRHRVVYDLYNHLIAYKPPGWCPRKESSRMERLREKEKESST